MTRTSTDAALLERPALPLTLDLPQIDPAQARLRALFARNPPSGEVWLDSGLIRFEWVGAPHLESAEAWHRLRFTIGGVAGEAAFCDQLPQRLLAAAGLADQADLARGFAAFSRAIAALIGEHALSAPLVRVEAEQGWQIEFAELWPAKKPLARETLLTFACKSEDGAPLGFVQIRHDSLLAAMEPLGEAPLAPGAHLGRVPVVLSLLSAGAHLQRSELGRLHAGDAIVFGPEWAAEGALYLAAEYQTFAAAQRDGAACRVTSGWAEPAFGTGSEENMGSMSKKRETPSTSELAVVVTVEHASMQMTMAELGEIGPGSVVTFDTARPPEQVRLLANGAPFAEGQLVRLGDEVGVQITKLI